MNQKQENILVVGSSNYDIFFKSKKLPRTGETVMAHGFFTNFGGKGANQAIAAAKLGGKVNVLTCVGNDDFGKKILDNYKENKIDLKLVKIDQINQTGIAAVDVDSDGKNIIIVYPGANSNLLESDISLYKNEILSSKIILTQLEIPLKTIKAIFDWVSSNNIVILNPSPMIDKIKNMKILERVDILLPNEVELSQLSNMKINTVEDVLKAARSILKQGVKSIIATLGEKGVCIVNSETEEHIEAIKVDAVDTTGAGDAFAGGFAYHYSKTLDLLSSAKFANCVGALSVSKSGTQTAVPTLEKAERLYHKNYC